MRKVSILLVLVLLIPVAIFAQDSGKATKIGIVNLQALIQKTELGKSIATTIQQFSESRMATINQEQQKLQSDLKQLQSQASILSAEALTERQNELQKRDLDLKQKFQKSQREFKILQNEEVAKFFKVVVPIIESVGLEQNYTLILDNSATAQTQIVYVDKSIDITDAVIARVNAKATK